jgi:hypothetical protein
MLLFRCPVFADPSMCDSPETLPKSQRDGIITEGHRGISQEQSEVSMMYEYADHFALFLIPLIFIFLLFLAVFVFVVWTLIDVLRNEFTGNNKIIWLLTIILLPPLGSILYVFIGREQKLPPDNVEPGFQGKEGQQENRG